MTLSTGPNKRFQIIIILLCVLIISVFSALISAKDENFNYGTPVKRKSPTPVDSSNEINENVGVLRQKRQASRVYILQHRRIDFSIAVNIQKGNIEFALQAYVKNQYNFIGKIIEVAYDKNLINFFNILKFAKGIKSTTHLSIVYITLYDQMQLSSHLNTTEILLLNYEIKETVKSPFIKKELKLKLKDIDIKLESFVRISESLTTIKLINGQFIDLLKINKINYKAYEYYIPNLLKFTYINRDGIKPITKLITQLPWIESVIVTLVNLHEIMVLHRHMEITDTYLFESYIKYCMKMTNYAILPNHYKHKLKILKSSLQKYDVIDKLLWQESAVCVVRNVRLNELLYAGPWRYREFHGRDVSTSPNKQPGSEWRLTFAGFFDDGAAFNVTNLHYVHENLHSYKSGHVRTRHDKIKGAEWVLEPTFYKPKFATFKLRKINNRYLGVYNGITGAKYVKRNILGVQVEEFWRTFYGDILINIWELKCK